MGRKKMVGEIGEKRKVQQPTSAFLILCKHQHRFVREKYLNIDNRSVTRVLKDLWANLGEEKQIYQSDNAGNYKEAFMKANHKYHKSKNSCRKMVIKSTSSRVTKNVAEIPANRSMTPGRLTDIKMMDGLNLLLMAGREARSANSSSSLSSKPAATLSIFDVPAKPNTYEQPAISNSALLQLAEMCTSELQSSTKRKLSSGCSSVLADPLMYRPLPNSTFGYHEPESPPKKRARRWSLTFEADSSICCTPATSSTVDIDFSSRSSFKYAGLSTPDLPVQTVRCTSMNDSDDEYVYVEKCKSSSRGRKLSSSGTESIPSPSFADEVDDAELPLFSRESENLTKSNWMGHEYCDQNNGLSVVVDSPSTFVSDLSVQKLPLNHGQHSVHHNSLHKPRPAPEHHHKQPPHQPKRPLQFQHPLFVSTPIVSRPLFFLEKEVTPCSDKQSAYMPQQNLDEPLNNAPSLELHANIKLDVKSKDKNNPNFQKWREPGKSMDKFGETSPERLKPPAATVVSEYSSPILKMTLSGERQPHHRDWHSDLARVESGEDRKSVTGPPPDMTSSSATSHARTTITSSLGEGRIASLLRGTDTPTPHTLSLDDSDTSPNSPRRYNETENYNKGSFNHTETGLSKSNEQNIAALTLPSVDKSRADVVQPLSNEVVEAERSAASLPVTSTIFSKGKLKKKWTERMLVEAKLEENLSHCQADLENVPLETSKATTSLDAKQTLCTDTAPRNIPDNEHGHELSTARSVTNCKTFCVGHPEWAEELKMYRGCETENLGSKKITLASNESVCSTKAVSGQTDSPPSSFNVSRHPKLMLQLSQNQQLLKPDHLNLPTSLGDVKVKFGQEASPWTSLRRDQHQFSFGQRHSLCGQSTSKEARDHTNENSKRDSDDKNFLNQITTYGRTFINHFTEQKCQTELCADPPQFKTECSGPTENVQCGQSSSLSLEKSKEGLGIGIGVFGFKEKLGDGFMKNENNVDLNVMTASCLVEKVIRKVCDASQWRDGCRLYTNTDERHTDPVPLPSWDMTSTQRESSGSSRPNDTSGQSPSAVIESCDHRSIAGDTSLQPVRKSRRANRGQKYQELIKEGFLQPSRGRIATKNAEKSGKNLGVKEDCDKVEVKKLLKFSTSERNTVSNSAGSGVASSVSAWSAEKLTFSNCDPNKEVKPSLACNWTSQNKKKTRHRCEIPAMVTPCHRVGSDVTASTSHTSLGSSNAKVPQQDCHVTTSEVGTFAPGLHTTHIPVAKIDQRTEPVTGSRKRKARKHCITRISLLDKAHQ